MSEKELIDTVRSSLEEDGHLASIKAQMTKRVMDMMDRSCSFDKPKKPKSTETIIVNEIVREYLDWMGYKYTSTILIAEADLSKDPMDRTIINKSLGTEESVETNKLPLLVSLIETFRDIQNT